VQIRVEGPGELRIEKSEVLDNTAPQLEKIHGGKVKIFN